MDYSKIMYVAVTGDTKYDVNTVSRPTQYKSGLDYDIPTGSGINTSASMQPRLAAP